MRTRARWMAVVGAVGLGCGAPPRHAAPVADAPTDVAAEVAGVVQEAYGSLGHGNREGVLPLLADGVYVIGPGARDRLSGRSDVVVALAPAFPADSRHKLASHALRAVVSPGGKSAWVSDQLDVDGVAYAATAVMVLEGDLWVAAAIHVGRPMADKAAARAAGKGELPAAPKLAAKIDPGAEGAAALFAAAAKDPAALLDQLADGPDVLALGPGPKDAVRGGAAVHKAWKAAQKKDRPAIAIVGGPRAGVTPDGQLAWVHADVTRAAGDGPAVPRRAFYLYARDGAGWRLIAAHESIAAK